MSNPSSATEREDGGKRRKALHWVIMIVILASLSTTAIAEESAQELYLKASKMIREGDYASARVLLERILDEYGADEIAIKADDKLSEIMEEALVQERSRKFHAGYGFYVISKSGDSTPLQAYKITKNNMAVETGDPKREVVRALSENLPYPSFVLTDIDEVLLYTSSEDASVFRNEFIRTWFPYHLVEDLGPSTLTKIDDEVFKMDHRFLSQLQFTAKGTSYYGGGAYKFRRGGVSAPLNMGFDDVFVSQKVGTWGENPGPFTRTIWVMQILLNHREQLWQICTMMPHPDLIGNPQVHIQTGLKALEKYPYDPSIEWFLAEQYELSGDPESFNFWSTRQLEKADSLGFQDVRKAGMENIAKYEAVIQMTSLLSNSDSLLPAPALQSQLEAYANGYKSNIAYYLLSILKAKEGNYKDAETLAKKADKATKKETPLLMYCGLIPGVTSTVNIKDTLKNAHDEAKKIFKSHKEEMKRQKKDWEKRKKEGGE